MSDLLFDLACVCVVEELDDVTAIKILSAYLQQTPTKKDLKRFQQMRLLAATRYGFYCYLQTKLRPSRNDLYRRFADHFLTQAHAYLQG